MFNTFHIPTSLTPISITPPVYRTLKSMFARNIETALNYNTNNSYNLPKDHILIQYLTSFPVPLGGDSEVFEYRLDKVGTSFAALLQMTSEESVGKIFTNQFYNAHEVIYAVYGEDYSYDDIDDEAQSWKNFTPVKVLRHDYHDLDYALPSGRQTKRREGFAVIKVDVKLLMIMYRCFRREQFIAATFNNGTQQTIHDFLNRYVLNKMIPSQLDIMIFNRMCLHNGLTHTVASENVRIPFLIDKADQHFNEYIRVLSDHIRKANIDVYQALANIEVPGSGSIYSHLEIFDDWTEIRQMSWMKILIFLPYLKLMVTLTPEFRKRNSKWITRLDEYLLHLEKGNMLYQTGIKSITYFIEKDIEELKALMNN